MGVTATIMGIPPSHNQLRRKYRHHAAYGRLRDAWANDLRYSFTRKDVNWLATQVRAGKRLCVRILIQHSRLYDVDNAYASCKPIMDGLVKVGFLRDDSPTFCDLRVEQEKIRAYQTKITIGESF